MCPACLSYLTSKQQRGACGLSQWLTGPISKGGYRELTRPVLLDLFCGAGGASMGYYRAGFEIVGVDIEPQPHYPFRFILADALTVDLSGYDAIHASPKCQRYSTGTTRSNRWAYADQIPALRKRLRAWGGPYVIENVMRAPLRSPVMLCGAMFGLKVYRHRIFESNVKLHAPDDPEHVYRIGENGFVTVAGHNAPRSHKAWSTAMGIDWATALELTQMIPPAYTEYIGKQLIGRLSSNEQRE